MGLRSLTPSLLGRLIGGMHVSPFFCPEVVSLIDKKKTYSYTPSRVSMIKRIAVE